MVWWCWSVSGSLCCSINRVRPFCSRSHCLVVRWHDIVRGVRYILNCAILKVVYRPVCPRQNVILSDHRVPVHHVMVLGPLSFWSYWDLTSRCNLTGVESMGIVIILVPNSRLCVVRILFTMVGLSETFLPPSIIVKSCTCALRLPSVRFKIKLDANNLPVGHGGPCAIRSAYRLLQRRFCRLTLAAKESSYPLHERHLQVSTSVRAVLLQSWTLSLLPSSPRNVSKGYGIASECNEPRPRWLA